MIFNLRGKRVFSIQSPGKSIGGASLLRLTQEQLPDVRCTFCSNHCFCIVNCQVSTIKAYFSLIIPRLQNEASAFEPMSVFHGGVPEAQSSHTTIAPLGDFAPLTLCLLYYAPYFQDQMARVPSPIWRGDSCPAVSSTSTAASPCVSGTSVVATK